jgi:hypothetical protein
LTWIKPSFLWMMYRCGWGTKDGQETVLAVEISREGFVWALRNACLSHYVPDLHGDRATWKRQLRAAPACVQWDPERDVHHNSLPYRSLQLCLAGEAAARYADEWIVGIEDVTPLAAEIHACVRAGELDRAAELLPMERAVSPGRGRAGASAGVGRTCRRPPPRSVVPGTTGAAPRMSAGAVLRDDAQPLEGGGGGPVGQELLDTAGAFQRCGAAGVAFQVVDAVSVHLGQPADGEADRAVAALALPALQLLW